MKDPVVAGRRVSITAMIAIGSNDCGLKGGSIDRGGRIPGGAPPFGVDVDHGLAVVACIRSQLDGAVSGDSIAEDPRWRRGEISSNRSGGPIGGSETTALRELQADIGGNRTVGGDCIGDGIEHERYVLCAP